MKKEKRIIGGKLEIRESGGTKKITGYAAVFNSLSEDLGGFREKINPGAFRSAIKKSDTVALFNHDSNIVLGRTSAGTLELKEDKTGLFMEIDPPDTQAARDLMVSIERGDIKQQSFGFIVKNDSWETVDGEEIRTIGEVEELYDVSPVTYPAYPDTSVALRSLEINKTSVTRGKNSVTAENENIEIDLLKNKVEDLI
jgi:HK97 family phage prohead protease